MSRTFPIFFCEMWVLLNSTGEWWEFCLFSRQTVKFILPFCLPFWAVRLLTLDPFGRPILCCSRSSLLCAALGEQGHLRTLSISCAELEDPLVPLLPFYDCPPLSGCRAHFPGPLATETGIFVSLSCLSYYLIIASPELPSRKGSAKEVTGMLCREHYMGKTEGSLPQSSAHRDPFQSSVHKDRHCLRDLLPVSQFCDCGHPGVKTWEEKKKHLKPKSNGKLSPVQVASSSFDSFS